MRQAEYDQVLEQENQTIRSTIELAEERRRTPEAQDQHATRGRRRLVDSSRLKEARAKDHAGKEKRGNERERHIIGKQRRPSLTKERQQRKFLRARAEKNKRRNVVNARTERVRQRYLNKLQVTFSETVNDPLLETQKKRMQIEAKRQYLIAKQSSRVQTRNHNVATIRKQFRDWRRETMRDIAHKYERINARKQLQQRMAQSVKDKNRDEFIQRAAWKEEMERRKHITPGPGAYLRPKSSLNTSGGEFTRVKRTTKFDQLGDKGREIPGPGIHHTPWVQSQNTDATGTESKSRSAPRQYLL